MNASPNIRMQDDWHAVQADDMAPVTLEQKYYDVLFDLWCAAKGLPLIGPSGRQDGVPMTEQTNE